MEPEIRKIEAKPNELISWQSIHQKEERRAVQLCVQAKTKLIPAFVQLMKTLHSPEVAKELGNLNSNLLKQTQSKAISMAKQNSSFKEQRAKDSHSNKNKPTDVSKFKRQTDVTRVARTSSLWSDPPFEVHTSGLLEIECTQLTKACQAIAIECNKFDLQSKHLFASINSKQMRGVLPSVQFGESRWKRIFLECERSAARILYGLICYLEQNATIGENVHVVEYKEADFFFARNTNDAILGMPATKQTIYLPPN